jgi:hypothetical protein
MTARPTFKHTPGPWMHVCWGGGDSRAFSIEQDIGDDPETPLGKTLVGAESYCQCPEKPGIFNEADARLIAAAPELLAALQAIVKALADQDDEGMIEHAQQMIDARAVIAKATSQQGGAA